MGDLLDDVLNDRLEAIPTRGVVDGRMNYVVDPEDFDDSESESDTEQQNFVKKEMSSYFPEPTQIGGLTDIEDGHEESVLGTDIIESLHVPRVFSMYKFDAYYKKPLPIDGFKTKILNMIGTNSVVIIHGPTGCGKTTQVPQYILDQCREQKSPCNIVVTQPRRIAAINIAQRVCEERGWTLGTVCGYQVGLDRNVGDDVILTYMTTEVLLQKLINQKNLNKFTHIIIDEVHERTKNLDFLLLIVRKYLFTNSPAVKLVLMSATMEAEEFATYFKSIPRNDPQEYLPAPILHVDKKNEFITNVYYNEQCTVSKELIYDIDEPFITPAQYEACLKLIQLFKSLDAVENTQNGNIAGNQKGSVLVFLPGFHEIEQMHQLLDANEKPSEKWDIIPLHSSLTFDYMEKVFLKPKPNCRKIILSTNIAESSVTVSDVKYVIDFCLTKNMCVNEVTKFSALTLQWASHNNCIQRAGRVGRVADGRVYRLVPKDFYKNCMPANSVPELQRAPLENVILYMKLLDLNDTPKNVLSLAISPPNLKDVESCIWRLKELGALLQTCRGHKMAADGDLTFLGRVMGSLPIDITLSKLIVLGHLFSCLEDTVIMAAGCMTKNVFVQHFHERFLCYRKKLLWADGSSSDFMLLLNLYNVWWKKKRENDFKSTNDEITWCKINYVNLKGLREWEILVREIHSRLKRLGIESPTGVQRIQLSQAEKPTILKVIICGAFYPNYFVRSADYGKVDNKEVVRVLNNRDPFSTVYFTNMKSNQPGKIYVRQIKKIAGVDKKPGVQVGFDQQSCKVFIEFKNTKQLEEVTVNGRQYITTNRRGISVDVYEAVRKRQLNMPFRLQILPDQKAREFAEMTEKIQKRKEDEEKEGYNCFSELTYSPFPSLDIEYISVSVTHIIDAGHFYCHNWNDETKRLLYNIFGALNAPGVFLEPAEKVTVDDKIYAARFFDDGKFYRCKILDIQPGRPPVAQVQFIDYGNIQRMPVNLICQIPSESRQCQVSPIAMCCVLSEVQPSLLGKTEAIWSETANSVFQKRTQGVLLNAKVYSVIDETVHVELYLQNQSARTSNVSFNQWLINEGLGQRCEESQRSKMDHELRLKVQSSEDPSNMSNLCKLTTAMSYADFDEPELDGVPTETIFLRGPFSPLEMKVCGLVEAGLGSTVRIDGDSVNAVLLDDRPEDPHSRLLVAAHVGQSSSGKSINLSQTTLMPALAGFAMKMALVFCPQMEPKLTPDGSRVASILCGMGAKEYSERANFPNHDITLVLDTELNLQVIEKVDAIRSTLNQGIRELRNIYDSAPQRNALQDILYDLKSELFSLLYMEQNSVEPVNVKYANVWNRHQFDQSEILRVDDEELKQDDDIWELLWFVSLDKERHKIEINENLNELLQIAKRLVDERQITCKLCKSDVMNSCNDIRLHLFKQDHKRNLKEFENSYLRDNVKT